MALVNLIQAFFVGASRTLAVEETLPQKFPILWEILWLEPLSILRRVYGSSISTAGTFSEDVRFLLESRQGELISVMECSNWL